MLPARRLGRLGHCIYIARPVFHNFACRNNMTQTMDPSHQVITILASKTQHFCVRFAVSLLRRCADNSFHECELLLAQFPRQNQRSMRIIHLRHQHCTCCWVDLDAMITRHFQHFHLFAGSWSLISVSCTAWASTLDGIRQEWGCGTSDIWDRQHEHSCREFKWEIAGSFHQSAFTESRSRLDCRLEPVKRRTLFERIGDAARTTKKDVAF
mmetsp:Transcript_28350/g.41937  ORF Transcript_28350/g.41937 Transcript_28350/m.41937 type:complete len:211 (-) Transcript_28350:948-1580(-)